MRILAIGDIHGCLTALDRLLAEVRPQPEDLIITLGDYVDRGPESRGVIERLLSLAKNRRLLALRGNHEVMMLRAWEAFRERGQWHHDPSKLIDPHYKPRRDLSSEEREWLACGGKEALASYGGSLDMVPAEHWEFLELTCDWYETEKHLFVHANVHPDIPLEKQPSYMLHWEKLTQPVRHCSGKIMVCGHTPQASGKPRNWDTTICLDTGIYRNGWLTCLDVNSGKVWQSNQQAELRTASIDDFTEDA
jgi:serine/threonine protein phosphatase 1